MLGMGWIEIFVVVIVALFVIGPENLPEVARTVAKSLRQLQRIVAEIRATVNLDELERQPPRSSPVPMPDPPVLPRVTGLDDGELRSQKTPSPPQVAGLKGSELDQQPDPNPPKVVGIKDSELESQPVPIPPTIKPDSSSQS